MNMEKEILRTYTVVSDRDPRYHCELLVSKMYN